MKSFFFQLRGELKKLFARKRTYIGFGAFLGVEILVLLLLRLPRVQKGMVNLLEGAGYSAEGYLSGLSLAFLILLSTVLLLGALYLALVSGDVVSKEIEDGTFRMMLCRPVTRGRILALKLCACIFYTFVLTLFIAATSLAAGTLYAGWGGMFVFAPMEGIFAVFDASEGLRRFLLCLPILAWTLCTVTCMGFCLSCMRMKPAAATIVTLSVLFMDSILKNIPFFSTIREWFITARMAVWVNVFEFRIPWDMILENMLWLTALNATLVLIGWAAIQNRDMK